MKRPRTRAGSVECRESLSDVAVVDIALSFIGYLKVTKEFFERRFDE